MNNINIAEILKDCPKGTKLYSPICGECEIINVEQDSIEVTAPTTESFFFNWNGTYCTLGEVLLFPSKDNRDWRMFRKPTIPKFKIGDKIKLKGKNAPIKVINAVHGNSYNLFGGGLVDFIDQDDYVLAESHIDELNPFDKVLVRDNDTYKWKPTLFGYIDVDSQYPFVCIDDSYKQCIPYKENKHLVGSDNPCNDKYKVWK